MATCKELNDEVDGNKDEMSMSIQGSMEDGQECCSTDDSDTSDIDSDATKGIDIVVHYQKKIRKIKHDLTKQIHIPLTWERNLKLQYIYNNQDILQPKVDELRKLADKADINRGIVDVYFGKVEDETVIDSLKNTVENILFDQTDHLALSWFPIPSSMNSSEFREELKAMLPDSELGMKQQLYVDTSDVTFVRFVHDENVIDKVSDLFNDVFLKAKANTMSGASTDSIQLPFVYFDMLEKQGMVENVTKAFPDVCLFLDAIESEEILRIKLKGHTEVLQRAKTMIHDTIIKPLTYVRIMFDDIVDFCEQVDIAGIVGNILEHNKATDICWAVNKFTRNIHICGKNKDETLRVEKSIKTCIEKKKVSFNSTMMPTAEGLPERLKKMLDEHKTTAISKSTFRLMLTSEGVVLFTTGWKKQNDYLSQAISRELARGHETNTPDLKSQTKNLEEVCTTENIPSMNINSEIRATNPDVNLEKLSKNPELSTTDKSNQSLQDYSTKPTKSAVIEPEVRNTDVVSKTEDDSRAPHTNHQLKHEQVLTQNVTERERTESMDCLIPCSLEILSIVKERKRQLFRSLIKQGCQVSYGREGLHISNITASDNFQEIQIIVCYVRQLQQMSITEVELDQTTRKSNLDIQELCRSIEQQEERECCLFCKEKYSVLVYCDTYENAKKIKHQILVKDGQVKVTLRRGPNASAENSITGGERGIVNQQNTATGHRPDRDRVRKGQKKSINPEFTLEKQSKNLERYTTDEGIQVLVYQANILKLPVDCIVNTANDSLQHGGGVARVIAQAAGRTLDIEGFEYIRKHGKVPVGKVCVTTAGKLHYDCVIHTVGPCWYDYRPHSRGKVQQCEKDLYSAIMESFLAAEARGLESIALPAVSSAIFAVPTELCVYHYAKATLDYSRKKSPTSLKEIHFIDINPYIIPYIQGIFTAFFIDKRDPCYLTDRYVKCEKSKKRK